MTHLLAYLAGVLTAMALWAFFFLFSTREEAATAPRDPYVERLLGGTQWSYTAAEGGP